MDPTIAKVIYAIGVFVGGSVAGCLAKTGNDWRKRRKGVIVEDVMDASLGMRICPEHKAMAENINEMKTAQAVTETKLTHIEDSQVAIKKTVEKQHEEVTKGLERIHDRLDKIS